MSICADLGTNATIETLFFCGSEGLFVFDALLTSVAVIGLIAVMSWKFRLPPIFSLLIGLVCLWSMNLIFDGNPVITSLMVLSMLGIGVFLALSILDYYKNYTR